MDKSKEIVKDNLKESGNSNSVEANHINAVIENICRLQRERRDHFLYRYLSCTIEIDAQAIYEQDGIKDQVEEHWGR